LSGNAFEQHLITFCERTLELVSACATTMMSLRGTQRHIGLFGEVPGLLIGFWVKSRISVSIGYNEAFTGLKGDARNTFILE
jgi:hypothetical protein